MHIIPFRGTGSPSIVSRGIGSADGHVKLFLRRRFFMLFPDLHVNAFSQKESFHFSVLNRVKRVT